MELFLEQQEHTRTHRKQEEFSDDDNFILSIDLAYAFTAFFGFFLSFFLLFFCFFFSLYLSSQLHAHMHARSRAEFHFCYVIFFLQMDLILLSGFPFRPV